MMTKKIPKNNLRTYRQQEGLTITELSNVSGVSAKVISETERAMREPKPELKYRVVNALNKDSDPPKYKFEEVFPNHNSE